MAMTVRKPAGMDPLAPKSLPTHWRLRPPAINKCYDLAGTCVEVVRARMESFIATACGQLRTSSNTSLLKVAGETLAKCCRVLFTRPLVGR